jgi:AraC family transcriptional regulator
MKSPLNDASSGPWEAAMGEPVRGMRGEGWRAELLPGAPYAARYVAAADGVGFAFDPQAGLHAFDSDRLRGFRTRPNSLAYVPKGCEVVSRSEEGGEYLRIAFERPLGGGGERRFNDRVAVRAVAAAHRLRAMLLAGTDPLAAEALVWALREAAAGLIGVPEAGGDPARWMTPRRLRAVEELIEARLGGPLTVAELAGALGLSPGFFIRAFRAAVGRSPHAHILDRRIARARRALAPGRLTEVALDCGFSSHAHMTAAFRQRLGVTPASLLRA